MAHVVPLEIRPGLGVIELGGEVAGHADPQSGGIGNWPH